MPLPRTSLVITLTLVSALLSACEAFGGKDPTLTGTYWRLVELEGKPAEPGAEDREIHLVLEADIEKVRGYAGCNNFTGGFETDGQSLSFGPVAATRRACIGNMDQELDFLNALDRTERYTLTGDELVLYDNKGAASLGFEAGTP